MLKKTFRLYRDHYVVLLRLGVPIMIGQLGIIIVGFADNMMVGHHTSEELAAASFVNNLCFRLFSGAYSVDRESGRKKSGSKSRSDSSIWSYRQFAFSDFTDRGYVRSLC